MLVQIMLGGITRLTGSGLSITTWDIVTGTLPPLSASDWDEAFALYKDTPQYKQINEGMSMSRFKFIFFWEYIHRLWARTMGFVFIIPFLFFLFKGWLTRKTVLRLLVVVVLAALAATFGWIMVSSGLVKRPWVNAYKLTIHLSLGIALFLVLVYTWLKERGYKTYEVSKGWKQMIIIIMVITIVQIWFGGFVSGMRSALNYPSWPTMNGEWVPSILLSSGHWNMDSVLLYDQTGFMPALVQFIHRNLAYCLALFSLIFSVNWLRSQPKDYRWIAFGLVGIIIVQILLGILTLLGSKGSIPVFFGAMHQAIGILLLTYIFYIYLITNRK